MESILIPESHSFNRRENWHPKKNKFYPLGHKENNFDSYNTSFILLGYPLASNCKNILQEWDALKSFPIYYLFLILNSTLIISILHMRK